LRRNLQVIVIGAGPAGATLAFELANRGIRTLVLERKILPRYKCCAGGLTVKAAQLLGIDIDNLIEDVIYRAMVTFRGNNPFYGSSAVPFMYTVRRETFDHALVQRAQEAGAEVLQGVAARAIRITDLGVEVATAAGSFRSEFLVGADGPRSQVRKAMDIDVIKNKALIVGLQTDVRVTQKELARWKSQIGIDIGRIRGGYGWVFPKSDHLSIGVGALADKARGLKNILAQYRDSLKLGQHTVLRANAGLLPACIDTPVVSQDRAILIGDAAGLADPLSGEGLHNAILSARLGAAAIDRALNNSGVLQDDYRNALAVAIIPQMKIAHVFSKVLAQLPGQLFRVLNKNERIWPAWCHMLCGEIDYITIKNKIRSLGRLYDLIVRA
jgi:geranylgeranyl reductase family protein